MQKAVHTTVNVAAAMNFVVSVEGGEKDVLRVLADDSVKLKLALLGVSYNYPICISTEVARTTHAEDREVREVRVASVWLVSNDPTHNVLRHENHKQVKEYIDSEMECFGVSSTVASLNHYAFAADSGHVSLGLVVCEL